MTNIATFGCHLIVGLSGTTLSDLDKRILTTYKPAGILLLARNFLHGAPYDEWRGVLAALLDQVYTLTERDRMLITLDHEGGRVVRTPAPITTFPYPCLLNHRASIVARSTALELNSMGVNVSWAPVTDINSNPKNPIIGARAFGRTAEEVVANSIPYMLELRDCGIISCAKHFPGHGDTSSDSHLELPVLNLTEQQLWERELIPFKAMVEANVPMIMTAHILFPKIDAEFPATMSKKILHKILREKMNYNGVIVSDDLDMRAVSAMFDKEEMLSKSFEAGCDMFIIARHLDTGDERIRTVANHFKNSVSERLYKPAQERINKLLASANRITPYALSKSDFERHYSLALEISGA